MVVEVHLVYSPLLSLPQWWWRSTWSTPHSSPSPSGGGGPPGLLPTPLPPSVVVEVHLVYSPLLSLPQWWWRSTWSTPHSSPSLSGSGGPPGLLPTPLPPAVVVEVHLVYSPLLSLPQFTRPTSSASIKIYEQGTNELVESLDASTDLTNVVFPTSGGNTTLKFYTATHDPNVNYYVLLDPGGWMLVRDVWVGEECGWVCPCGSEYADLSQ